MDKKLFDSLDETVREKLRNCKDEAELRKVSAEAGLQELSVEILEGVSGGNQPGRCDSFVCITKAPAVRP